MSRKESDREDLLREATALVERVELDVAGFDEPIFVGIRAIGCWSVFFGAQPVYQFNSQNELRRAYADGHPIKAQNGKLVSLERRRTDQESQLLRHELSVEEAGHFIEQMKERMMMLRQSLTSGNIEIIGQIPPDTDIVERACGWLDIFQGDITVASSPRTS